MLSCKDVSQLVSQSLDRKLPVWQRIRLRLHLGMCRLCSGFEKDLWRIRRTARRDPEQRFGPAGDPEAKLSPEARTRIKRVLERHSHGDSPDA